MASHREGGSTSRNSRFVTGQTITMNSLLELSARQSAGRITRPLSTHAGAAQRTGGRADACAACGVGAVP